MATHEPRRTTQKIGHPRRGDIYLVNFEPTVGHEIQKTRPALILQNDIANRFSPITILAAMTTKFKEPPYPTEVIMESDQSGLSLRSAVLLNQIRSVDRLRLAKHLGRASAAT